VDSEVGISPGAARPDSISVSPTQRQAYYGELIAPLSQVLPPLQQSGRNDPIALLGRGMSSRDSQKKLEKAQKKLDKGKSKKLDSLEGGLKWVSLLVPLTLDAVFKILIPTADYSKTSQCRRNSILGAKSAVIDICSVIRAEKQDIVNNENRIGS
jgi:hypothetical protein